MGRAQLARGAAVFFIGALVGVAATLSTLSVRHPAPAAPADIVRAPPDVRPGPERAPAPHSTESPPKDAAAEPDSTPPGGLRPSSNCCAESEQLRLERDVLVSQLRLLGGARSEWPPDVSPSYTPESVRRSVESALPKAGVGTLVALECDEYPCVAFIEYPEGAPASTDVLDPFRERLESEDGLDLQRVHVFGRQHGAWAAVAIAPRGTLTDGADVTRRLETRIEELAEAYVSE